MSITSSNSEQLNPAFSALLTRYPSLVNWLTLHLPKDQAPITPEVLSAFLAACANQGLSSNEEPDVQSHQ